jgi:hypothetical protein
MPTERSDAEAYARLEAAVDATLARVAGLQKDLEAARGQVREMRDLLRRFSAGEEDPAHLSARLQELEEENLELLGKLRKGKEGVDRLLARIRFLEEQS